MKQAVALQSQLNEFLADAQSVATNIKQREEAIHKLTVEIHQYAGVQSYISQIVQRLQGQLTALAVSESATN